MKKIILIIIIVVLIAIAGYVIGYKVGQSAYNENLSQEEISKHEAHEEGVDEEHEHDHFVEIEGSAMRALTVQEIADLWEIDSEILLLKIIEEFGLQGDYAVDTILDEIRESEYKFSPAMIKDFAEEIKTQNAN